jgi:Holliday junction resolvase RusA-like endonuclease
MEGNGQGEFPAMSPVDHYRAGAFEGEFFSAKAQTPDRHRRKPVYPPCKKPDVDNLLKSTMDTMTEAEVWKNDALVFATSVEKWYARKKTGAQIIVETGF